MFDSAADTPDPAAVPSGAPARLTMLRKTAEIGVRMAERLDRQSELAAIYSDTCVVPEHLHPPYARRLDETARAFAPVARAIALAVALEDRIETDWRAGPAAAAERALKAELMALRVNAARSGGGARAGDADPGDGGQDAAPPTPAGADCALPRLRLDRLGLDRLADGGLAELDAWLRRPPDEVIAHIRSELGLGAGGAPAPEPGPRKASARREPISNPSPAKAPTRAQTVTRSPPRRPSPSRGKGLERGCVRDAEDGPARGGALVSSGGGGGDAPRPILPP